MRVFFWVVRGNVQDEILDVILVMRESYFSCLRHVPKRQKLFFLSSNRLDILQFC